MKTQARILTLMSVLVLAACGAPSVGKYTAPAPGSGYIYGIFELPKQDPHCGWGASLILKAVDKDSELQLDFSAKEPVGVFPVAPGRYRITHIAAQNCSSRESDRKSFSSPVITSEIDIKPNTAVYIGSYAVQTYSAAAPNGTLTTMVNLTRQCRDFTTTTDRFLKGWPGFSSLQPLDGTSGSAACIRPAS